MAKSYAAQLRSSLAELPVKKKCCAHAFGDAVGMFAPGVTVEERCRIISVCEANAKCPACTSHFVRGVFCTRGSVTDPEKRNHLEIALSSEAECEALMELLAGQGMEGKSTQRKNQTIFYLKSGEAIADFLAYIGANTAVFTFMNTRIERELRTIANRQVNCDTANIEKSLRASEKQIAVLRRMRDSGLLGTLPDVLRETAELRLAYEQLSLKELGEAHTPPIGKSGVNHRLSRLMEAAQNLGIEEE